MVELAIVFGVVVVAGIIFAWYMYRRGEKAVETDSQTAESVSKGKSHIGGKGSKQRRKGRIGNTQEIEQRSTVYYSEPPSSGFFTGWLLGSMLSGGSRSSYADSSSAAEEHPHHSDPAPDPDTTPTVVDDTPSHSDSYDSGSSDSSSSDSYSSDSSFDSGGSFDSGSSGGSFD